MKLPHPVRFVLLVLSLFFHSSLAHATCPAPVLQQLEGIRFTWQSAWDAEFARCQRLGNDDVCGHLPGPFRVVQGPASAWLAWRYCDPIVTNGGLCRDGTGHEMGCVCPSGSTLSPLTNSCVAALPGGGLADGSDPNHWEEAACAVGNPTLAGLGVKVHREGIYVADFASALVFDLHYRSRHSARALLPPGSWLHSYSARLHIGPSDVHALGPDGHVLRFIPGAAANTWASTESADTLKRIAASDPDAVSWELHRQQDDSRETYDHNGKLLKITARNGWASRLVYDDAGRLQAVYNAFRRQLRLQYDANGWLAAITTPDANVTRLSHDPQGNLLAITWPDGNVKRYHYEDSRFPRALTGITDETGQRIGSYTYDAQGRVIETQRAGGVDRLQFSYGQDASGAPQTTITDFGSGAPSSRTHRFALQGRVLRPAGASAPCPLCGNTAQAIAYDSVGRKLREVQHDGSVVFHQYNARGQETERASFPASFASASTRPALSHASAVTTTEWHGTWNLPTRVAEPGRISTYAYSASGVTAHTTQATSDLTGAAGFNAAPSGALQRTETLYSAQSLPQRISEFSDGVLGQRWDYGYSPQGDLVSVTDAMAPSQSATLEHDGNGRLSRLIASNGAQASFTANSRGQMTAAYTPGGNITYVHDARNLINEIRFSDGRWVRYSYSPAQQLIEIRDSSGLVEQIASSDTEGLDPQRLMQRVAQWLSDRGDRIAQMLLPPVHANPVLVLVPAGVVLGIMSVAEANRLNAAGIPGSNAAGCGANCQGGAGQSASASGSIPSVAGIGWLTQVGIVLSGQSQASSVPSPPTYDKAGLLVSPQSCVPPPGNCTPNDHRQLQDQVDQWCKAVPRACRAGMVRSELNERLENGRACGTARDKLNKKCFAGGDADHRNEAAKAWKAVANCESILSKLP